MFATPARIGSICGWSPSDDNHGAHYTTIPTPAGSSTTSNQILTLSSSSTPRSVRNPIPRNISFDSNEPLRDIPDDGDADDTHSFSLYHNPTSLRRYKLKRSKDPSWAPRPPNAFILFRRDYVEQHKGEALSSTEKTTLSWRAANAWRALKTGGQKPWFERAKVEAADHLRRNPGYVFRPKKQTRSELRKHPALLSRREKVEELCLKRRRLASSKARARSRVPDECPTPGSAGSATSPEPPCTPLSEECPPLLSDSSSCPSSIPPPQVAYPTLLPPGDDRAYLSGAAMASMPSLIPDRQCFTPKRSFSYTDGTSYDFSDFFVFDDPLTESDDKSIRSFESYTFDSSPGVQFGEAISEQFSTNDLGATLHALEPQPQPLPPADPPATSQLSASTSFTPPSNPSNGPLFERRRRSATTSMIPSPLTVITSSLAGWARDDLTTARMIPRADTAHAALYQQHTNVVPQARQPMTYTPLNVAETMWTPTMRQVNNNNAGAGMNMLAVPIPEAELDCTPRIPAFPQNVQSTYDPSPLPVMIPSSSYDYSIQIPEPMAAPSPIPYSVDPLELTRDADYESYRNGLRQYGIGAPMTPYGTPPLDNADYGSFYGASDPNAQNC